MAISLPRVTKHTSRVINLPHDTLTLCSLHFTFPLHGFLTIVMDPGVESTWIELHRTVITVNVGPDAKPYIIFKELACRYSRYFEAMYDRKDGEAFEETKSGIVNLTDANVRTFEHFFQWLETQSLDHVEDHVDLLNLYILAEYLGALRLLNSLIDELYKRRLAEFNDVDMVRVVNSEDSWTGNAYGHMYSPAKSLEHLRGQVCPDSKILTFFVEMFCFAHLPIIKMGTEEEALEELPGEFLWDVLVHLSEIVRLCLDSPGPTSSLLSLKPKVGSDITASSLAKKALIQMTLIQLSLVKKQSFSKNSAMHKDIERHHLCSYHDHKYDMEKTRCAEGFQQKQAKANNHNIWPDWRRVKKAHDAAIKKEFVRAEI
ncbi:uncharacterized protein BDZ99DRAFT_495726 [Mytilinidion resinicola]|uniref:BTB domain-containing protein n=1 Tax=Mytilinidion resinicola TaxID=574789 RepID=A0A6A6Z1N2_9PEZI|nr:uncharacterized protein BDZ99DRAFT_495726 [Mytilinidion resinicola]KAF2814194.1 hypothetical protein BDZ99DRAFT_495726 [Mytilinidion resinicola]